MKRGEGGGGDWGWCGGIDWKVVMRDEHLWSDECRIVLRSLNGFNTLLLVVHEAVDAVKTSR